MEIIKGYDVDLVNYDKPTPKLLKKIADFLLATILVINPIMLTIPDFEGKGWVMFGWNMFVALFKLISKTVTEKTQ